MDTTDTPLLEPPGAGLPALELMLVRWFFRGYVWGGSVSAFTTRFEEERQRVRELISVCDEALGDRQVLIPRPRGLEDSSRHWSVWMTLEHLRLIHESLRKVMLALSRGVSLEGKASTAAVKPPVGITSSVIPVYEASCDALISTAQQIKSLKTELKFAHPWFGPLDAYGWYAMAPFHLRLHRAQIQTILKRSRMV